MVPNLLIPVQTIATSLHVASVWTHFCMLLGVVAQSLAPVKLLEPTTPNISFVPWSPKRSATMLETFAQLFQQCWGHARAVHMVFIQSLMDCIVPTMHCRSQQCWQLLRPVARSLRSVRKSMTIILMIVQSSFRSELTDSHTFGGWNLTAGFLKLFKLRVGGTWVS